METLGQGTLEFGKFDFIKKLGEGGFGEVWLAEDPRRGEKVAVKFLHLRHCDQKNIDVFKREFELLSELKQVHLARVFDFGFSPDNEQYFLSAEFCPGAKLLEAIAGKPVEYFEEILVQMLSALECIHAQGIIHFDIKPENILVEEVDGRPNVKLVDFGVAVRLQALPQEFGGTLAFLAPEVLERNPKLDHRVDLYSLGMVCLLCLTGRLPFAAQDQEAAVRWHRSGRITSNLWKGARVPGYLREITEKLLAKNPAERFSNSRVVLNFLNLATGGKYRVEEEGLHAQVPIEGPLVERREAVLGPIQSRLEEVLFSEGPADLSSVYFLSGEAGIGKTRVLEEMRHAIQLREIRFLQIDCDWNIPSLPKLENWLKLPELSGAALAESSLANRLLDFILEAAQQSPLCLLVDDFHKADQDFRKLVFELAAQTQKMRQAGRATHLFLLVATEEDLAGAASLPRLGAEGILSYLKLVLGEQIPLANLAEVLYQYSGGLPLLVVEGLRFLAPHFFRGESLENLLSPAKIHFLYDEKIQRLSPPEKELLLILALMFRPVAETEILEILGRDGADFVTLAENNLKWNLITGNPFGEPVYRVSSQALALDLIGALEPEARSSLHAKIVQGLKRCPNAPLQELAYHSAKAGYREEAVDYYCRSGALMEQEGKIATACDHFNKALDLMEPGSEPWRRWSVKVLRLLVLSGDYQKAGEFPTKLEPYPSAERDETLGWYYFKTRQLEKARESYEAALRGVVEDEVLRRILLENALGNVDLHCGRIQEAAARFRTAFERENQVPEADRVKIHNNNLGMALSLLGEHEEAIRFYRGRLAAIPAERVTERLTLLNSIGYSCLLASRYAETISYLQEAMALAENSGAMNALFSAMGNLLTATLKENRYDEAIAFLQKMVSYQRRFGNRRDIAHNLLRQSSVYLMVGMGELALACIEEGHRISREVSDGILAGWFMLMHGYWEREFGSPEKAVACFERAQEEGERAGNEELKSWASYGLGEIACDRGDLPECRSRVEAVSHLGKDHEFDTRLGLLKAKIATDSEAGPQFAELERECLRNNYRELLWELYHGWAEFCLRRKDREQALLRLEQAVRIIEEICSALPEEYQGRYRNQPARKKVREDLQAAREARKPGLVAKLKSLLRPGGR